MESQIILKQNGRKLALLLGIVSLLALAWLIAVYFVRSSPFSLAEKLVACIAGFGLPGLFLPLTLAPNRFSHVVSAIFGLLLCISSAIGTLWALTDPQIPRVAAIILALVFPTGVGLIFFGFRALRI